MESSYFSKELKKVLLPKRKTCTSRESNPGLYRGRVLFYHQTTGAALISLVVKSQFKYNFLHSIFSKVNQPSQPPSAAGVVSNFFYLKKELVCYVFYLQKSLEDLKYVLYFSLGFFFQNILFQINYANFNVNASYLNKNRICFIAQNSLAGVQKPTRLSWLI